MGVIRRAERDFAIAFGKFWSTPHQSDIYKKHSLVYNFIFVSLALYTHSLSLEARSLWRCRNSRRPSLYLSIALTRNKKASLSPLCVMFRRLLIFNRLTWPWLVPVSLEFCAAIVFEIIFLARGPDMESI